MHVCVCFFFNDTATTEIYTLSLHDALPISSCGMWDAASVWFDEQCYVRAQDSNQRNTGPPAVERANLTTRPRGQPQILRSEEHTSELQSRQYLVCRLLLEKKN